MAIFGLILVALYWNLNPGKPYMTNKILSILVAPYWNLTFGLQKFVSSSRLILVAPYWNLNVIVDNQVVSAFPDISSSILEFKWFKKFERFFLI